MDEEWINYWIDYVQGKNVNYNTPPGPMDNTLLAKYLFEGGSKDEKRTYYMISRRLYFFLHGLYGGGPALVGNEKFYNWEEKQDDLDFNTIQSAYEENKNET